MVLAGFMPLQVTAQPVIRIATEQGRLGSSYDGNWRNSRQVLGTSYAQNSFRQWLVIPVTGSLISTDVLNYTFKLLPSFTQQLATDLPDPLRTRNLGYQAYGSLLSGKPVSMHVNWARTNGLRRGGFGTQGEFDAYVFNPTITYTNIYLPLSLAYSNRINRNALQVGPGLIPIEQADQTRNIHFTARNRKLDITYDWLRFDDRLRENDFSSRSFQLYHWLRWGKGSELNSTYQQSERAGSLPYTRRTWSEKVKLQHTEHTESQFNMNRYFAESPGGETSGITYGGGFSSQFLPWLGAGADASTSQNRFDDTKQSFTSFGPWANFSTRLPLDAQLSGRGALGFIRRDLGETRGGFIQVLREAYSIDNTGLLTLNQLRIETQTLLVQNNDETLIYIENLDYQIIQVGDLTQIDILPGSRIQNDETILINYRYQPVFEAEENGYNNSIDFTLRVRGWVARHHRSRRATGLSGEGSLPISGDFDQQISSLSTTRRTRLGQLRLDLSHRNRRSQTISYETIEARATFDLPPVNTFQFYFDVTGRQVSEGEEELVLYALQATSIWSGIERLRIRATSSFQQWTQRFGNDQQTISFSVSSDYRIGRTDVRARYEYDRRKSPFLTHGNIVSLYLLRRF